jgi:hypothetical protein
LELRPDGDLAQLSGVNFQVPNVEKTFVLEILQKKTNYHIYRINQKLLAGDYVIIDLTDTANLRGWVVELKSSGGAGNQLTNWQKAANAVGLIPGKNAVRVIGNTQQALRDIEAK